eukprot:240330-Pelagomonas_calceolata.AAC.6
MLNTLDLGHYTLMRGLFSLPAAFLAHSIQHAFNLRYPHVVHHAGWSASRHFSRCQPEGIKSELDWFSGESNMCCFPFLGLPGSCLPRVAQCTAYMHAWSAFLSLSGAKAASKQIPDTA